MENNIFTVFDNVLCNINASQYDNTLFSFTFFHVPNGALVLHSTLVHSFYIDLVLTLSIGYMT